LIDLLELTELDALFVNLKEYLMIFAGIAWGSGLMQVQIIHAVTQDVNQ
jgi:hypothetical protein